MITWFDGVWNCWQPSDKPDSLRSLYARITVGHDTQQSSVQYKTVKPRWDQSFQFLVDDPETRPVTVEVCVWKCSVLWQYGVFAISLARTKFTIMF